MNLVLREDLERIADSGIDLAELEGSSVLVTGATGLVGSMLVKALLYLNQFRRMKIKVFALIRDRHKANTVLGEFGGFPGLFLIQGDLNDPEFSVSMDVDYIIHAAAVTTSRTMIEKPVETIHTALNGTDRMLALAVQKKVKSFVYVSSMEMYGSFPEATPDITEEQLGYLNVLAVRSNYPESKRLCENLCVAYAQEYGVPVKVARLAQTFGAGILPGENRVFAQMAKSVISGKNIILHTKGLSEGNYTYLSETIDALLLLLLHGKNRNAYNIANEACHTTIAGMAEMVAGRVAGGKIRVVYDLDDSVQHGYAAETHLKLSSAKVRALGWNPKIGLEEAYRRTIDFLTEECR